MSRRRPHSSLDGLEELDEFVMAPAAGAEALADPLLADWRLAAVTAREAYGEWRRRRDSGSYAVYRACVDRADAAQDALAARA